MRELGPYIRQAVAAIGCGALLLMMGMSSASAGAGCSGTLHNLYVEENGDLYFHVTPSNECICNYSDGWGKFFRMPAAQANNKQSQALALAALLSGKPVSVWFDWTSGTSNASACLAHNVRVFR